MDIDWCLVTDDLVGRFGTARISKSCEISVYDLNRMQRGVMLDPSYSSGVLMLEIYQHFYPEKDVELK